MPLGYKYAERDATSYVDWGAIGKNMTDMLQEEDRIRREKKQKIDDESRAYQNVLANPPQGESVPMNEYALKYADDAQKARLLQDRLLKSGQLSLRDYTVQRQNLLDGTDQLFNLSKEYQDEYKATMDAYLSDDPNVQLQDLTAFLLGEVEGYANFTNTKPIINQRDYSLSVGKMVFNEETGVMEMSKDPNDFATVSSLRNRIKQKYKKYNVQENVKGFVDALGDQIDVVAQLGSLYKTGTITETLSVLNKKNLPKDAQGIVMKFEEAERKAIESRLGTPYDYTSVLTNSIKYAPNGEQYTFTWNEEDAKKNKNLILLKTDPSSQGNPVPQLTKEQREDVIKHMTTEARLMYDYKQSVKETEQLRDISEWRYGAGQETKDIDNTATMIGSLWGGKSGADIKKATTAFRDINPAVKKVERTPTKVLVTMETKGGKLEMRELPFRGKDGRLMTQQEFIMSAGPLLGGNADWKSAVQRGGYLKGAKFNDKAVEVSAVENVARPAVAPTAQRTPGELN